MKILEIRPNFINDENSNVTLHLEMDLEDIIDGDKAILTIKDNILISLANLHQNFEIVRREHPFFKMKLCESPIELKFFVFALYNVSGLKPQVSVGKYRVDFAIPEKKVAIEIDGHEFHKTRSQRTLDAKRERYLLLQGWRVIRFTGSEIHADVVKCMKEVVELVRLLPIIPS